MVIPLPYGGRLQPVQWLSSLHLPITLGLGKNFVQMVMFLHAASCDNRRASEGALSF
jgi:hypothetical protein